MDDVRLIPGDYLAEMRKLDDASCDAVITDPPCGLTRLEWDRPIDLAAFRAEAPRVARPDAASVIFAQQPFATGPINPNRRMFEYDLVWSKDISTGFLDANRRPLRSRELVLVFGRRIGYNRVDWPRPPASGRIGRVGVKRGGASAHRGRTLGGNRYVYGPTACPRSILPFARPGNYKARQRPDHRPTRKPIELMQWLVAAYSPAGGTVLDPFMGSGSTGLAAARLGRRLIGIDLGDPYVTMAGRRIHRDRAAA